MKESDAENGGRRRIGKGALVINALVFALVVVSAVVGWYRWERETAIAEGEVPLPPGTEVVREKLPDTARLFTRVYTCRVPRSAEKIADFYVERLTGAGWKAQRKDEHIYLFTRDSRSLRLVLHPQTLVTVFTLNYQVPRQ